MSPDWDRMSRVIEVMVSNTNPITASVETTPVLIGRESIGLFAGLSQNLTSLTLTSRHFSFSEIDTILLSFENHKLKRVVSLLSASQRCTHGRVCSSMPRTNQAYPGN